ncbi:MAG TPA: M14 family metallopeptidase [Thermoanaerobaculia bacterium]|nr:M14 family metallopeptidase [Thermoanaerobaculia bacterium]
MRARGLTFPATAILALFVFSGAFAAERPLVPVPPNLLTWAEVTGFRKTETYDEVLAFLARLERQSPYLRVSFIGPSEEGRRIPVVVASKEKLFEPGERYKSGKPVVLVLNSIHAGEVDGTDATLMLLRDIALGNRLDLLDGVTLVTVVVYNVDGHARVSPFNRPNQNGPEEMGYRVNARGLDLNRDFVKADAVETRALLALAEAWKPDLFVDDHVTDGADFQAALTVSYANEPVTPKPLGDWLKAVVPKALSDVEEAGFGTLGAYVDFLDARDPMKGFDSSVFSLRYSTGYFPARNVPSILVETHALKPFEGRVRANFLFLRALLERTGRAGKELLAAREKARAGTRLAPPGSPAVVAAVGDAARPESVDFPTYEWTEAVSPVTGRPVLHYDRARKKTIRIPSLEHAKAAVTVPRPAAYLIPAGFGNVEERLKAHGIRYERLPAARTLAVGTYRASGAVFAKAPYQGRVRLEAKIARALETRAIPAGSLYVPLDTELANVAIALLEPESPDSLFSWGEFSSCLEEKEYMDVRVLDPLAEEMLAKDPKLQAEWEEKLTDPQFANDARARHRFFFRRTPFSDDTVGLVPVFRLDAPLSVSAPPAAAPAAGAAPE